MTSLLDRARALLTAKSPPETLAEVRQKIGEAEAEVGRLDGEIRRRALPILRGDHEAARVAVDLERDKQARAAELATLRTAEGQLAATVAAAAERQASAAKLPAAAAEMAEQLLADDDEITQLAGALAAKIKARIDRGYALAGLVGSEPLKRANDTCAWRVRSTIANLFRRDLSASNVPANNLLGLVSSETGPRAWLTLHQLDQELLDDECPYFADRESADQAAARLAARHTKTLAHELPGGAWTLIRADDLYIDRAAAEGAARMAAKIGATRVVTPYGAGFLVRPPRAADAVLAAEPAA